MNNRKIHIHHDCKNSATATLRQPHIPPNVSWHNEHNMRTRVYSLIVLILLNSCATIIHKPYVGINIQSNTDSVRVFSNQNGSFWDYTPTQLKTIRSKDDISITAVKDTIQQTFSIKSRLSTAFWLGNLFSGAGVVGYAIDILVPNVLPILTTLRSIIMN